MIVRCAGFSILSLEASKVSLLFPRCEYVPPRMCFMIILNDVLTLFSRYRFRWLVKSQTSTLWTARVDLYLIRPTCGTIIRCWIYSIALCIHTVSLDLLASPALHLYSAFLFPSDVSPSPAFSIDECLLSL